MTGRKIFVAVPMYDSAPALFVQSLMVLVAKTPVAIKIVAHPGDSLVTRARNVLTADFLASDCTHLLFIDSDLVFTPEQVERITSHQADVVGGMYAIKKEGPLEWCGNGLQKETLPSDVRAKNGMQMVRFIGCGFMCIARNVFERMREADPEIEYTSDLPPHRKEWDFWRVGVRPTEDARRRYLSEDWYFCQRWLELGGWVWADTGVVLPHVGRAVFPLQSQWRELEKAGSGERGAAEQPGANDNFGGAALPQHQPRGRVVHRPSAHRAANFEENQKLEGASA